MKIVQIDGIKGLITAVFVCACAFSGFVISPGYALKTLWNKYLVGAYMFPNLSLFQGILLWAILVISYFIVSKKGFALSFKSTHEISEDELKSIVNTAKLNSKMKIFNNVIHSDKFVKNSDENLNNNTTKKVDTFVSSPLQSSTKVENEEKEANVQNIK